MDRTEAIVSLMPMVSQVARKVHRQVPQFGYDDLVSEGMIGAIQAVDRYDEEQGVPLPAFAHRRVLGQIWDHVRAYSHLSRNHYAEVKAGEADFHMASLDEPVASAKDGGSETSLVDMLPDDEDAISRIVDQLAVRTVMDAIPEKHQDLLQAYYYAGMTLREIGELRGVTESRICQQMNEAHDWAYHYLMA